jgi:ribosomal protein L37AE/L43A
LGSSLQYLGDADEKGADPRVEKLKILKRSTEGKQAQDKASVKYNYVDFLSAADNLTDQCKHLVEALSQATQECIICSNPIYQRSAIWNCKQCCQPFHLGCIKRWINKLNTGKEAVPEELEGDEEEEKVRDDARGRFGDEDDDYEDEARDAGLRKDPRAQLAFYSWTCPNCNYSYAESSLPRYKCYCGRY